MEITAETPVNIENPEENRTPARTNGFNEEQIQRMLAVAGRYKDDTEFLKRWDEGIAEYRRKVQEQAEHDLEDEK